jgi:hypothetical protein
MTAILDVIAGLSLAAQLQSSPAMEGRFLSNSMPVAVTETRQGMYKEYTVERVDDKALDEIKRGYKTAEETDESKNKVKSFVFIHSPSYSLFIFRHCCISSLFSIGPSSPSLSLVRSSSPWPSTTGTSLRKIKIFLYLQL